MAIAVATGAWSAVPAAAAEGKCPVGKQDPVCEYLANGHEAPPVGSITSTAPGAIEPLPVNKAIEEEFEAELRERKARGSAAVPAGPSRPSPSTKGLP